MAEAVNSGKIGKADPAALRALLARLEAADGPDRELDRALHVAVGLDMDDDVHRGALLNAYTASIDTAVALVRRVLPGTNVELDFTICADDKFVGGARMWLQEFGDERLDAYADSGSRIWHPALATVACAVRALLARAEKEASTDG